MENQKHLNKQWNADGNILTERDSMSDIIAVTPELRMYYSIDINQLDWAQYKSADMATTKLPDVFLGLQIH